MILPLLPLLHLPPLLLPPLLLLHLPPLLLVMLVMLLDWWCVVEQHGRPE
jgi:hypothetical protein